MNNLHLVSAITLGIIFLGLVFRRKTKLHIPLMLTAFTIDIVEVLYIELNRQAIKTATNVFMLLDGRFILMVHILISLATVIMYLILIKSGFTLLKARNDELLRIRHRDMATIFIVLRVLNFITSFWVLN